MPSSPNNPPNDPTQGHPPRTTSRSNGFSSPATILLVIISALSAIFIAYLVHSSSRDQNTANVSRFSSFARLFARQPSQVPARAASSSAEGFKSGVANLGAETEFKMRTPVYFISHGGVSLIQAVFFGFFVLGYSIGLFLLARYCDIYSPVVAYFVLRTSFLSILGIIS